MVDKLIRWTIGMSYLNVKFRLLSEIRNGSNHKVNHWIFLSKLNEAVLTWASSIFALAIVITVCANPFGPVARLISSEVCHQ